MDTLEDIDARIAVLREDIRKLCVRRNALSGFCRLPPEITVHILSLLQTVVKPVSSGYSQLDYKKEFYEPKLQYSGKWMRALVCTHIRSVALAARSLWGTFKCTPRAEWTDLCLERAGEASLELILDLKQGAWKQERINAVTQLISSRVSQFRFLSLNLDHFAFKGPQMEVDFKNVLDLSAPMLLDLYISANTRSENLELTERFLGGHPSVLQSLHLLDLSGISNPPAFPALRSLELTTTWIETVSAMESWVARLGHIPAIQKITLRRDVEHWSRETSVNIDDVDLPAVINFARLDALIIADYIEHLNILLRVIPEPACTLHISVASPDESGYWSPANHETYKYVISYAASFWKNHTGEDSLPDGTITALSSRGAVPDGALNTLEFQSSLKTAPDATLSFLCRCRIDAEHPLLEQIGTLYLASDRTGPGTSGEDLSGAAFLSALRRVVIANPRTAVHLLGVERWMKRYAKTHGPIEKVDIRRGLYEGKLGG
jgi:hypothetical protein